MASHRRRWGDDLRYLPQANRRPRGMDAEYNRCNVSQLRMPAGTAPGDIRAVAGESVELSNSEEGMTETAETVTPVDLDAAREICNRATPGPWTREKPGYDDQGFPKGVGIAGTLGKQMVYANPPSGQFPSADCDFIAAARTLLPQAIAEIERLRETVAFYVKAMRLNADPKGKWFKS